MTATRAPHPIPLSIRAEDLLVAAAIIAALGDRPGRAHLRTLDTRPTTTHHRHVDPDEEDQDHDR